MRKLSIVKKVILIIIIAIALVLVGCDSIFPVKEGSQPQPLWGSGVFSGTIAAPIATVELDLDSNDIVLGSGNDYELAGKIVMEKSSPDTIWGLIYDKEENEYYIRFFIEFKNQHGLHGNLIPFNPNASHTQFTVLKRLSGGYFDSSASNISPARPELQKPGYLTNILLGASLILPVSDENRK